MRLGRYLTAFVLGGALLLPAALTAGDRGRARDERRDQRYEYDRYDRYGYDRYGDRYGYENGNGRRNAPGYNKNQARKQEKAYRKYEKRRQKAMEHEQRAYEKYQRETNRWR